MSLAVRADKHASSPEVYSNARASATHACRRVHTIEPTQNDTITHSTNTVQRFANAGCVRSYVLSLCVPDVDRHCSAICCPHSASGLRRYLCDRAGGHKIYVSMNLTLRPRCKAPQKPCLHKVSGTGRAGAKAPACSASVSGKEFTQTSSGAQQMAKTGLTAKGKPLTSEVRCLGLLQWPLEACRAARCERTLASACWQGVRQQTRP